MAGIGLFSALDVAISGMFVSNLATQVVNHNIANANTPGYSRQALRIGSKDPISLTFGVVGRGATADGITRSQNLFLEQQVVDQTSLLGDYNAMDETLRTVETILGGMDNDHVRSALDDFFDAWQGLSVDTNAEGAREAVVGASSNLARQFNLIDDSLALLERDVRSTFTSFVDGANTMLAQVGELNRQIVAQTVGDQLPNDLLDQRQQILDALAEDTRFTTVHREDGTADILIEGHAVVTRGHVNELRVLDEIGRDGALSQRAVFGGRNPVTVPFETGSLSGYQRMSNEVVPEIRAELDALAKTIIDRVNDLHRGGVTEQGTGVSIFTGDSAATMTLNEAVANNNRLIATGRDGTPGDNTLAKEIANLGKSTEFGAQTLDEIYVGFIGGVANQRGLYDTLLEGQQTVVQSARARLDAEKGVNIDEELANLVMYQRSFEANARVIRTVDEMLSTIVNLI